MGILHPETSLQRPDAPQGWVSKRIGASGGRHIRRLKATGAARSHRYYQRELKGEALSATAVASPRGSAFAFVRPWCRPFPGQPFRYGGTVTVDRLDPDLEARIIDSCLALVKPLGLIGLVSFDFIVDENGEAYLVEVNPRPGASLEVLDDATGTLFKAHIAACRGEDAVGILTRSWRPKAKAATYLYADKGPLRVASIDWPDWVSDVPAPGQIIAKGAPIATVGAEGRTPGEAREMCKERLATLEAVVYRRNNK